MRLKEYGATPTGTLNDEQNDIDWEMKVIGETHKWFKTSDYRPLTQLDGESVVTTPGWYDFTRQTDEGDGARYITVTQIDPETGEEVTRIVVLSLNSLTTNLVINPLKSERSLTGATVAAVPVGNNTLNENEVAVDEAD